MYCSLDDIKQQVSETTLIEITDDNQANEINTKIIDEAILYSETLIDGYLRGRYTLPLATIAVLIKIIAADLTVFIQEDFILICQILLTTNTKIP